MSDSTTNVFVGGMQVGAMLFRAPGIAVHRGIDPDGEAITILVQTAVATEEQKESFRNVVKYQDLTGMQILKHDAHVVFARPSPAGTLEHLGSLNWDLTRRLEVFWDYVRLAQRFHARDTCLGPMLPKHIMFDVELRPFILAPQIGPRGSAFAAPETVNSGVHTQQSDVYALGKLLHFVLVQRMPERESDAIPQLRELLDAPAGLVRIVRKATCLDPAQRYEMVDDLLEDLMRYGLHDEVGRRHPDVEERNFDGMEGYDRPPKFIDQSPKPLERQPVDLGQLPVVTKETRVRWTRGLSAVVIAVGFTMAVAHEVKTSGSMHPVPSAQAQDLSSFATEASLSSQEPPLLIVQVGKGWQGLPGDEQETEAKEIFRRASRLWGVKNGFVRRGDAIVVQYRQGRAHVLANAAGGGAS